MRVHNKNPNLLPQRVDEDTRARPTVNAGQANRATRSAPKDGFENIASARNTVSGAAAKSVDAQALSETGTLQLQNQPAEAKPRRNLFQRIGDGLKSVGNAVVNTVRDVGNAVVSVGKGLVEGARTFGGGLVEGIGGFFSNIVQLKVGDAFQSLVRGADKAFLQAPQRLVNGVLDGAQHLVNGASHLLGPLGKPVREVGTRVLDATRTVVDTGVGMVRDVYRTATETPLALVRGVEESIRLATQGRWGEAAGRLGRGVADAGIRLVGGAVDVLARGVQGAANAALTLAFAEAPSRSLSDAEIQMLKRVYGDSIDYSMVRLKQGGSTDWVGMAPHVVGNTIYMPNQWGGPQFNEDGSLTEAGLETLVHEAGHVWQNQNGGGDFVHRSLLSQLIATLQSGSRNGAYEWREGYAQGKSFAELNPEQQAHLIEDIGVGLRDGSAVEASDWTPPLSDAELSYVLAAWEQVKRGEGSR